MQGITLCLWERDGDDPERIALDLTVTGVEKRHREGWEGQWVWLDMEIGSLKDYFGERNFPYRLAAFTLTTEEAKALIRDLGRVLAVIEAEGD